MAFNTSAHVAVTGYADALMKAFEDEGVFWLSGKDDAQQAGRLRFDAVEGATLSVVGGFGDVQEHFSDQARCSSS